MTSRALRRGAIVAVALLALGCAGNPHVGRGRMALDAGDESTAAREFAKAVEISPDDPGLWRDLARTQFRLAQHVEAEASIEQSLAIAPGIPDSILLRAQIRMALGRADEARVDAHAALETLESAPRMQELAILFLRLHDLDESMSAGQRAIELSGQDPTAYANLAILAAEARKDDVVRQAFSEGRALHPEHVGLAQAEAAWLVSAGELEAAREAYRGLLRIHPKPGLIHLALALLHHQDGQLQAAHEHALAAVERLGGVRADVHYTHIVILGDLGRGDEAREHLERALQRFPGDAQLRSLAAGQ